MVAPRKEALGGGEAERWGRSPAPEWEGGWEGGDLQQTLGNFINPWRPPGGSGGSVILRLCFHERANGSSLYPHRPAPGRGWRQPWRWSRWSGPSGWRLGGTCWGCWRPSSPSTGRTSPGARRPVPRPRAGGRAAAAAAGAGSSPVPSGTAGAAAAAAGGCSGRRSTCPRQCSRSPGRRAGEGGRAAYGRGAGDTGRDPGGGTRPVRRQRGAESGQGLDGGLPACQTS